MFTEYYLPVTIALLMLFWLLICWRLLYRSRKSDIQATVFAKQARALRHLLDESNVAIMLFDYDGNLRYANQPVSKLPPSFQSHVQNLPLPGLQAMMGARAEKHEVERFYEENGMVRRLRMHWQPLVGRKESLFLLLEAIDISSEVAAFETVREQAQKAEAELQGGSNRARDKTEPGASTPAASLSETPAQPPKPKETVKAEQSVSATSVVVEEPLSVCLPGLKVLLVDDNGISQQVSRNKLERLQCSVTPVDSGQEAIEVLRKQRFDVILVDVLMPEMDGRAVVRTLRAGEAGRETSAIPVIALAARTYRQERIACLADGMNDYLGKSSDVTTIANCIAMVTGAQLQKLEARVDNQPPEQAA